MNCGEAHGSMQTLDDGAEVHWLWVLANGRSPVPVFLSSIRTSSMGVLVRDSCLARKKRQFCNQEIQIPVRA